jgi:GAF domain-containing protein
MFVPHTADDNDESRFSSALDQLRALTEGERSVMANLANASALLNITLDRINWVGFYLFDGTELVLGPFQGLPACIRIPLGKGVCGTAGLERRTIVVPDVHAFPGHIACDSASQSEIVVPLFRGGRLFGVLDVDSPELNRFGMVEQDFLEAVALILFP